jgi:hypothetical protein
MADITHTKIDYVVKRKVTPGPNGIRLLVIGATPGEPYETGGAL